MRKFFDKLFRAVDRVVSGTLGKQLLFFLVITVAVFALQLAARELFFPSSEQTLDRRFWNLVFNFIDVEGFDQLDGLERWLILLTNLSGMVLFAGVLVALLTNTIYQRIDNIKDGNVYYNFSGHVVIIGFDPISGGLVSQLAAQNEIVLQTSKNVEEVRQELLTGLNDKLKKKITIVSGSRVSPDDIRKLNINKCTQVFLLGEFDEEDHDSQNVECLGIINEIIAGSGKNIRCHVLFNHHLTFAAFQQHEIPGIRKNIDFVPFNFYDMWAQKIFVENSYNAGEISYKPLDHEPITENSGKRVHLVVLGMSNMGVALGLQAAQICHFPNFVTRGIKTRITFIDENADSEMARLKYRLRHFFDEVDCSFRGLDALKKKNFTDVEFEFIKARFEDDEVRSYLEEAANDRDSCLTVAVALPDPSASLETALYLPELVYDSGASVLVRQENSHAIVSMLSRQDEGALYCKFKNLRPFGMLYNAYDLKQADDLLPMMVKYAYDNSKFNEVQTLSDFPEEAIRENWVKNWKETDNVAALKASNRYAANFIPVKQRSLGIQEGVALDSRQINLAARIEHNRWVTEKLLVGFRAPTPEEAAIVAKNKREYFKVRFIHEDIKAYQELGEDEKNIDVRIYDINISNALPYMIKAYKARPPLGI